MYPSFSTRFEKKFVIKTYLGMLTHEKKSQAALVIIFADLLGPQLDLLLDYCKNNG